jgi:hypothetical protein
MHVLVAITLTAINTVTVERLGTFVDLESCQTAAVEQLAISRMLQGRRYIFAASVSWITEASGEVSKVRDLILCSFSPSYLFPFYSEASSGGVEEEKGGTMLDH